MENELAVIEPVGQLLYDLAFVDRTDGWLARKHGISIGEVRRLRKSPILDKLRRHVARNLISIGNVKRELQGAGKGKLH